MDLEVLYVIKMLVRMRRMVIVVKGGCGILSEDSRLPSPTPPPAK